MGKIMDKRSANAEVKKHIATIHCANTLTLLQRKISNALLYHAYPQLAHQEEHEITIKQLCHIIGYSGNNHAVIKEALKSLIACVIEWNVMDEKTGEEDWTASAIIASAQIKGAKCIYAYSPRMRNLLHSPTIYGKINLIVQSKFRSSYGLALYENCVRYKGLPHTKWFDLELFRKLMGVPKDKYIVFRDFKKRVLDKSVEEINTYSDLLVEPEIERQGHKVIRIRFNLKERVKKKWLGKTLNEEGRVELFPPKTPLVQKLMTEYGFTSNQVFGLLEQYTEEFIWEKIKLIEASNSFQEGKIDKLAAYLSKALREDYQPAKPSRDIVLASKKEQEIIEQQKQSKLKQEEQLKVEYNKYMASYVDEVIANLSTQQFDELAIKFEQELRDTNNNLFLAKFRAEGIEHNVVRILFREFIKDHYSKLLPDMQSFAEFRLKLASSDSLKEISTLE